MAEYDIENMQAEDIVIRYFNALVRVYPGPSGQDRHVIQIFDNYDNLRIRAEESGGDYMDIIPQLINAAMNTRLDVEEFSYVTLMVPHSRFLSVQIIVKPSRPLPFYIIPDPETGFYLETRNEILRQLGVDPGLDENHDDDEPSSTTTEFRIDWELDEDDLEDDLEDLFVENLEEGTEEALEAESEAGIRSNAEQFYLRVMTVYQRLMFYDQIERAEMLLYRFVQTERQREIIRLNHDRQESAFNDVADLIEDFVDICAAG